MRLKLPPESGLLSAAMPKWTAPRLDGRIALVTGASRGVGKGIALVLGESGATVYMTGRPNRDAPLSPLTDTLRDAAAEVSTRGGEGVAVPTDHTDDEQVEALFDQIRRERGKLDLLVANAWGGYDGHDRASFTKPFWEQPLSRWDSMFSAGLRAQFTAARLAAKMMIEQGNGLIVSTGGWDDRTVYLGNVPYDVVKAAADRMVGVMAYELRSHGVAVLGVYPGFTRTEAVIEAFAREGEAPPAETHSPEFVGRAVASVLADKNALKATGLGEQAARYAARYKFCDVDGRTIDPFLLPATPAFTRP